MDKPLDRTPIMARITSLLEPPAGTKESALTKNQIHSMLKQCLLIIAEDNDKLAVEMDKLKSQVNASNKEIVAKCESDVTEIKSTISTYASKVAANGTILKGLNVEKTLIKNDLERLVNKDAIRVSESKRVNVIFKGVPETGENPRTMVNNILKDIGIDTTANTVISAKRLGRPRPPPINPETNNGEDEGATVTNDVNTPNNKSPYMRPIKVQMANEEAKSELKAIVKNLKDTIAWNKVYIQDEMSPTELRERNTMLTVTNYAKSKGYKARLLGYKCVIRDEKDNSTKYSLNNNINDLPKECGLESVFTRSIGEDGIAFQGIHSPLSNFYRSPLEYNGTEYVSSEQAYQVCKARAYGLHKLADSMYKETCSFAIKKSSREIPYSPEWDQRRRGVMKAIVRAKFTQNAHVRKSLLRTGKQAHFI